MIFQRLHSSEEAESILTAHLFNAASKDAPIDQLDVIKWYKNFLLEKERLFVDHVLEKWLESSDYKYILEADTIISACQIKHLLEPLKRCLKRCEKTNNKLHQTYCKMIEQTIQELSH